MRVQSWLPGWHGEYRIGVPAVPETFDVARRPSSQAAEGPCQLCLLETWHDMAREAAPWHVPVP